MNVLKVGRRGGMEDVERDYSGERTKEESEKEEGEPLMPGACSSRSGGRAGNCRHLLPVGDVGLRWCWPDVLPDRWSWMLMHGLRNVPKIGGLEVFGR